MKKIFQFILLLTINLVFYSCISDVDEKHRMYADKYTIYSKGDTIQSPIKVYIAYPDGHKVMYHIFNGNKKGYMEVWHMVNECPKCKKLSEKK